MDIGARLKVLRTFHNLSIYHLAQRSGISQSFIGDIEAGRKYPTTHTLNRLCNALNISLAEFFSETPSQLPEHIQAVVKELSYLKPFQVEMLSKFLESFRSENS